MAHIKVRFTQRGKDSYKGLYLRFRKRSAKIALELEAKTSEIKIRLSSPPSGPQNNPYHLEDAPCPTFIVRTYVRGDCIQFHYIVLPDYIAIYYVCSTFIPLDTDEYLKALISSKND